MYARLESMEARLQKRESIFARTEARIQNMESAIDQRMASLERSKRSNQPQRYQRDDERAVTHSEKRKQSDSPLGKTVEHLGGTHHSQVPFVSEISRFPIASQSSKGKRVLVKRGFHKARKRKKQQTISIKPDVMKRTVVKRGRGFQIFVIDCRSHSQQTVMEEIHSDDRVAMGWTKSYQAWKQGTIYVGNDKKMIQEAEGSVLSQKCYTGDTEKWEHDLNESDGARLERFKTYPRGKKGVDVAAGFEYKGCFDEHDRWKNQKTHQEGSNMRNSYHVWKDKAHRVTSNLGESLAHNSPIVDRDRVNRSYNLTEAEKEVVQGNCEYHYKKRHGDFGKRILDNEFHNSEKGRTSLNHLETAKDMKKTHMFTSKEWGYSLANDSNAERNWVCQSNNFTEAARGSSLVRKVSTSGLSRCSREELTKWIYYYEDHLLKNNIHKTEWLTMAYHSLTGPTGVRFKDMCQRETVNDDRETSNPAPRTRTTVANGISYGNELLRSPEMSNQGYQFETLSQQRSVVRVREETRQPNYSKISQKGTVAEYRTKFESMCLQMISLPGKSYEELFWQGLRPSLQAAVRHLSPNILVQMMDIAQWVEEAEEYEGRPDLNIHVIGELRSMKLVNTEEKHITRELSIFQAEFHEAEAVWYSNKRDNIRVRGLMNFHEVKVETDSGATSNFISQEFVVETKLPYKELKSMVVNLGQGLHANCLGICQAMVTFQGVPIIEDYFVLDLVDVDVILGYTWLSKLGEKRVNWQEKTWSYYQDGSLITLRGKEGEWQQKTTENDMLLFHNASQIADVHSQDKDGTVVYYGSKKNLEIVETEKTNILQSVQDKYIYKLSTHGTKELKFVSALNPARNHPKPSLLLGFINSEIHGLEAKRKTSSFIKSRCEFKFLDQDQFVGLLAVRRWLLVMQFLWWNQKILKELNDEWYGLWINIKGHDILFEWISGTTEKFLQKPWKWVEEEILKGLERVKTLITIVALNARASERKAKLVHHYFGYREVLKKKVLSQYMIQGLPLNRTGNLGRGVEMEPSLASREAEIRADLEVSDHWKLLAKLVSAGEAISAIRIQYQRLLLGQYESDGSVKMDKSLKDLNQAGKPSFSCGETHTILVILCWSLKEELRSCWVSIGEAHSYEAKIIKTTECCAYHLEDKVSLSGGSIDRMEMEQKKPRWSGSLASGMEQRETTESG